MILLVKETVIMRFLIFIASIVALTVNSSIALAELPLAPMEKNVEQIDATALEQHPSTGYRPNRRLFTNKSYWTYVAADVFAGAFDSEMSHEGYAHHRCVEGGEGLPTFASRARLYTHNLPEEGALIALGLVATKIRMPRWLLFATEAYPLQAHIRAGLKWREDCW
jgi:hypothetical protein